MIMNCIYVSIAGRTDDKPDWLIADIGSSSGSSRISATAMTRILENLKIRRNRDSTRANYYAIWKSFSRFTLKLDEIPEHWEDRIFLYLTNLVREGKKSTTVRSYFSALKATLWDDGYELRNRDLELRAITRACRLVNDTLQACFPIKLDFLEKLLCEIDRVFS